MTVTIFTWNMFRFSPDFRVGHASMHVQGVDESIYISFWPKISGLREAISSLGNVQFMTGDKNACGQPSWASKPLNDLNEKRIIEFWKSFDPSGSLDYKGAYSRNKTKQNEGGKIYSILLNQCSTIVASALLVGADLPTRMRILAWLSRCAGTNIDLGGRSFAMYLPGVRIPTVTPADVRELVKSVWKDF